MAKYVRNLTGAALCETTGISKQALNILLKRRGNEVPFSVVKGAKLYNAEEFTQWKTAHVKTTRPAKQLPKTETTEVQAEKPTPEGDQIGEDSAELEAALEKRVGGNPTLATLANPNSTPLELCRAAAQLAARTLSFEAAAGTIKQNTFDDFKKTLAELRQAEADYIDLAIQKGDLIERGAACTIIGNVCSRLVVALTVVENSLATEVDIWLADGSFKEKPSDERRRVVQQFVGKICREVRNQEANGAEVLVAAQLAEDAKERAE